MGLSRIPCKLLLMGSLLGAAAAFSPGGLFVFLLAAGTCLALHRFAPQEDRVFLITLFLMGFLVRVILSLGLDLGSWAVEGRLPMRMGPPEYWNVGVFDKTRDYLRMGDSDYYSQRGYCFAQYVQGIRKPVVLRRTQEYGWNLYALIIGWFYYLFGFSPISVKWLNGWFGALQSIVLFFLAKSSFQSTIARWTSVLVAFFPTLLLWSATNLKDPLLFLLTSLLFLLFRAAQVEGRLLRRLLYGVLFAGTLFVLNSLGREGFL